MTQNKKPCTPRVRKPRYCLFLVLTDPNREHPCLSRATWLPDRFFGLRSFGSRRRLLLCHDRFGCWRAPFDCGDKCRIFNSLFDRFG
jgi:hypothetical protein